MYTVRIFYTDGERETLNCKRVSYETNAALLESEDERAIIVPYYNVCKIEVE